MEWRGVYDKKSTVIKRNNINKRIASRLDIHLKLSSDLSVFISLEVLKIFKLCSTHGLPSFQFNLDNVYSNKKAQRRTNLYQS